MSPNPTVKETPQFSNELQQTFMRKAQRINQERINQSQMIKMRNRVSGLFLAACIGSIYAYTVFSVKQEKFLDELDDTPKKS